MLLRFDRMNRFGIVGLALLSATLCCAQPPPNDDFTNRTSVFGSSFTITADTTGATFDYYNEPCYSAYLAPAISYDSLCGVPSLWWSWTPTQSTTVVIERADADSPARGYLMVYATTNLSYDSQYDQVAGFYLPHRGQYAVFAAQAGKEYQISVASYEPNQLRFRFTATNAPVFRLQPKTQTISPGQSVLFTTSAVGDKPIHYQWRKDGVDILNATNQMLAFDNCTPANAAAYSVVATNTGGSSTSSAARLFIATNAAPPVLRSLAAAGGDAFRFSASGEEGRKYQIEYSNDLQTWQTPMFRVIVNTNTTTEFAVRKDAPAKFLRLKQYRPVSEGCNNGFRQLKFAIWQCAEERHLDEDSDIWPEWLTPYFINNVFPHCPDTGGQYVWATVAAHPNCESGWQLGHFFEEP
jgi:hypothetical protein